MIPESIRAELEAKGGLAGPPEPQGNGTTIYRAVSGDYIVVDDASGRPRMRGFGAPPEAPAADQPASEPPAAPAPAPAPTGAGGMNQQQMEAILQKAAPNGDVRRLEHTTGTKEKRVPGLPGMPEKVVRVTWHKWVDRGTGYKVEAEVDASGTYTVLHDGVDPKEQGQPATKPEDDKPSVSVQQVTRNGRTYTVHTTTPKDGSAPTVKVYGPDGKEVPGGLPDEEKKPEAAALVGQPTGNTRERYEGGRKIKEVEYVRPDGTKEWRAQESAADPKDEYVPEPEGAPAFSDVYGQVSSGLRTYSAWLDQQVTLYKQTNGQQGIAPDRATKLMARRIDLATRALQEQADIVNTQVGQRKDDIGQRRDTLGETQSRRGTAERIYLDILKRGDDAIGDLRPEDVDTHIAAREEQMRNALAYAREWGGLRESPEIGYEGFPAVQQIRQTSLAGLSAPTGPGGPRIFDPRVPGPPPAGTPTAPPAEMAPAFRPPPPVAAAAPAGPSMAAPAINPIDQSPIVLPSQLPQPSPMHQQARDDYRTLTPQVTYAPSEMQPGVPVQIPGAPDGETVPYPSDAALQSKISPRWMQETRYGEGNYFDPDLAGQQLSMELGIDPEIMKQAIASMYG